MDEDQKNEENEQFAAENQQVYDASPINSETSSDSTSQNYPDLEASPPNTIETVEQRSFFKQNGLLMASFVVFIVNICATFVAMSTQSYDTASTMSAITFYGGGLASLLLGAGVAIAVLGPKKTTGSQHSMNSLTLIGTILLIASMIGGFITLIPGIVLIVIGNKRPATENKPIGRTTRIILAIMSFIGAGIAGLVFSFVLVAITSQRACELSSSKCM